MLAHILQRCPTIIFGRMHFISRRVGAGGEGVGDITSYFHVKASKHPCSNKYNYSLVFNIYKDSLIKNSLYLMNVIITNNSERVYPINININK